MQLEQKMFVKTKKKETLLKVLELLKEYSEEEYDIEDYKNLTFAEDIYIEYDFFDYIYYTIKDDGIMIYMETDSCVDPYTDVTYYFGDKVKGKNYNSEDIFYSSLYDDSCINSWVETTKIKLTETEYNRLTSLGIKGKNIELANKNSKNIIEDGVKYKLLEDGYEVIAISRGPKIIKIKEGTKRINEDAIGYNDKLEKIILPETLEELPKELFSNGCKNLKTVTTYDYEELNNVIKLPSCIDTISKDMFRVCGFTELTIMEGIKNIEDSAFDDCPNLLSVVLPNSLEKIGIPFTYCEEFKEYKLSEDNKNFLVEDGILYNSDKTILYDVPNAYEEDCFIVPETVLKCNDAFCFCYNIEKIILNKKVTKISQYEFDDSLKEIVIPKNVEKISVNAFANCRNIKIIGESGSFAEEYVINMNNKGNKNITFAECV